MTLSISNYKAKPAEMLVLEGYRYWVNGYETGLIDPWEDAWNMYAKLLGPTIGRKVLDALSSFVRTLRSCAHCPLKTHPYRSSALCHEEIMILGLVASIQNRDDATTKLCLDNLTCPARCAAIEQAAFELAVTLTRINEHLTPIPSHVILSILSEDKKANTIH